ncbi:MAG TPA: inositol monophosphatase family protein [Acidothermaceae bacterium]|jgi:histidinol-phosphatase
MPYVDDLALARQLADVADQASLARFGALDLRVETKPDLTPVSDADRAVESALRELLATERPTDAILGEEYGASAPSKGTGRRWVIDPIDATKNFIRGVPVWATLIGLLDGDDAVVGVVSAPALAHRWWAAKGCGSWMSRLGGDPRRNQVSAVNRLADSSISYSDMAEWSTRRPAFQALLDAAWRARAYGDFWSHVLVAQGSVDISAEPDLSLWDVAALVPIVEEAGGTVTGVDGGKSPASPSVLCSNGLLHEEVLRRLRSDG